MKQNELHSRSKPHKTDYRYEGRSINKLQNQIMPFCNLFIGRPSYFKNKVFYSDSNVY